MPSAVGAPVPSLLLEPEPGPLLGPGPPAGLGSIPFVVEVSVLVSVLGDIVGVDVDGVVSCFSLLWLQATSIDIAAGAATFRIEYFMSIASGADVACRDRAR